MSSAEESEVFHTVGTLFTATSPMSSKICVDVTVFDGGARGFPTPRVFGAGGMLCYLGLLSHGHTVGYCKSSCVM